MTYEEILKTFNNRNRDYSFPPSALDNLNEAERKNIEELIIRNCLHGDTSLFDHLEKLKFYNIEDIFTIDILNKMELASLLRIIEILYNKTHNNMYIDYLLNLSINNWNAYSTLTIMYQDGQIDASYFQKIVDVCKEVKVNKEYYIKMIRRITDDEALIQNIEASMQKN